MTDDEALELAFTRLREDPDRREQTDNMLTDTPRREVLEFAAYSCQCRALNLKPWEEPPCHDVPGPSRALADRMRAAGVSIYHPDPLAALDEVG